MRSTPIIAAISMGLALAACSKKSETTTETTVNSDMSATNATAPMAAMPAQQFSDTVAASDMFEIQSGKLAETMGSTAAVKAFGKQLVADHTKSAAMFKSAAGKTSPTVALPMLLPADLKGKIAALKATSGAAFDKLFVDQQIAGHQAAVDALTAYAAGGDQASLKEFATTATPVVQGHLTALQAMPK